jgi:amino acid adenylation domain-containing protein
MQIYLLDSLLRLVPAGVPGEISIGGAGLARGYLNRPELTAERSIPHPFSTEPGARLYKTGDLARYLPDGTLEFLGRNDDQVKIRGYRIELGEIEAALAQHPAVRKSAVIAYDDPSGGKRLAAYIVLSQHQAMLSMRELRSYLQAKLPEYMIPSVFVPLETLPLTPSGKINRRALPTPDLTLWPTQQKAYRAPRTPIEEVLASIWAAVLGLDQVGMDDNFFELGGHSLLATQLVARVREAFQIALPLRSLFEMPTVATLAASIAERKGKSARSLDERIHLPTIRPNPSQRYVPFPLTDVQQAYWVGQSGFFELGGVATHGYLELESVDLDLERFSRAWQRLIDRHDMLRAIVHPDGQQQVLEQLPPYPIALLDLRGQDTEMMSTHLAEVRQQMSHQLFRTDQWPLFELRASRLDDHRTRLHISFHALIADAWSWQILGRELSECYQNPDVSLAPLELSFRDYVMAELALRSSEDYQRSQNYWWERLSTLPPAPELPLMESPSSLTHHRFVPRSATLGTQTWQQLKQRAIRVGATPSGVLLAAFAEILATWSKSPHFTLNLTLFNRLPLHPQVNDIVGDFTSLTLLEVKHSAQETFAARVRRLQEQLWDDLDHRYVNGVQVQRELARKQGGPPRATMPVVFSSALTLEKQGAQQGSPWSWLGTRVYSITQTPQVWLDHQVYEQAGAMVFNWDAVEELFPPGLLDEMFDAYCQLLHRLAHEEERWQEQTFQLVPRAQLEQRALVNATEAPLPAGLLQTGFAAQVPQRAQQPAVIAAERTLTYEELARRSNQVGHQLRHLGVEPNTLVAVVMEKGWEQIVGVLGILQAGAAYLPIDAGLPRERLWYLLKHGEVRVALTQSHLNETLEWPEPLLRLCLDSNELEDVDDQPLEPVQRPEDLAYVIYTSGSTGLPKGVMINHQGAVNTIVDINHRFGVGPQDRVLALSSLSFDLSVYDIFGTLAAGGTIVIPAAAAMRDPAHWTALMVRERITLWNSVPALMEMLVDYLANRSLKLPGALRLVLLSGDWIPVTLPGQIKSLAGGVEVVSLGGATEASIWSILYPIETFDPTWKSIPYGRPMVNQRFHVFNESLEPSPVWVPGQLYIGGIGLARGYWRDEAKTTASFFIHPKTGERLYRTGDLGRYLPNGSIEFLGREDFQVKIQGYRIELGEIEAALLQNPAVRATVVTVAAEPPRNKRLVAYVVPQQDATPSSSELRQFLHERLPDYMVPASFVLLDTLPLTPNGKVDRMALPAIAQAPSAPAQAVKAARTPIITRIAQVAASVLHSDELDPEINLLDFGANSVDMIRIVNRLELVLGFRPKLDEFFRFPTIVALARSYEEYLLQTHANPVQDDLESALNRENVASLEKPLNLEDREEGEL